jgi:activating signal cointegrator complex subunit 2
MEVPPLAPVPPSAVRNLIPNEEWEAYLDAWIILVELRLQISTKEFGKHAAKYAFDAPFLTSYSHQIAQDHDDLRLHAGQKARNLRRLNFLLTRRLLLEVVPTSSELLDWKFLGDMSVCYHSSSAFRTLLSEVWNRYEEMVTSSLESGKSAIMKKLSASASSTATSDLIFDIRRLTVLASALPTAGHVLMTGSDYLDALYDAYKTTKSDTLQRALVANAYVGLTSLLKGSKPNLSLLLDHLFTLKVAAGVGTPSAEKEPVLLSDLVCSTDMLARMERYLISFPQRRGQDLVATLRAYQRETRPLHHRYQKQRKRKDKGKERAPNGAAVQGVLHAHKLSLVTQIQDLFPDLGSGYVVRLLDFYDENVETVIAHLLDNSLPPDLQSLDKFEQLPDPQVISTRDVMEPRSTSPEILPFEEPIFRRRVDLEDDEIVEAARSGDKAGGRKVHFGRANTNLTADAILADRSQHATNKAAIISALATFDSDDDERDDTYDVADVGGTVDSLPTGTDAEAETVRRQRAEETEMTLFRAYRSHPEQFARNSATRRSQPRTALKRETGMTDEAIEGWAVMLERDPKKKSRLEGDLALAAGIGGAGGAAAQPQLRPTAYRRPNPKAAAAGADVDTETTTTGAEESEEASDGAAAGGRGRGGGGAGRGRGRGRGDGRGGGSRGGGRGGGSRGGRGANHHRRDQRAKKMARAGGLPG